MNVWDIARFCLTFCLLILILRTTCYNLLFRNQKIWFKLSGESRKSFSWVGWEPYMVLLFIAFARKAKHFKLTCSLHLLLPGISGISGNLEQKNVLQTTIHLMQSVICCYKDFFSGLFFFWTSCSEVSPETT